MNGNTHKTTISFIGGGNMTRAIAGGLIRSGHDASCILISEPVAAQRDVLQQQFAGASICADNDSVAAAADNLVLAVKPQILPSVCENLAGVVQKQRPLILSIAAGARIDDLDRWLGGQLDIVRVMPNQPALIGQGISALYANRQCDDQARAAAEKIMTAVGQAVWIDDESLLDLVTAVSGSGPAYFYLLIDVLIQAGIRLGLEPDTARQLAIETARGAAALAATETTSMSALIDRVRSPGGTTSAAFERLDAANVRVIFDDAIEAARNRSVELSKSSPTNNADEQ